MSVETISELAEETAATMETLSADIRTAHLFHDPDLQPHAVTAKREALVTAARTKATATIEGITTRAASAATAAGKTLASRPQIANDPAALIRSEQTWRYDILPLLEAGAPIKNILRDAGTDELPAIERFAAGYLRAANLKAGPDNPLELDPEELAAAVNNRFAAVLPEDQRAGFEDGIRTLDAEAKLRQIHEVAADTIAGRRPSGDREAYAGPVTSLSGREAEPVAADLVSTGTASILTGVNSTSITNAWVSGRLAVTEQGGQRFVSLSAVRQLAQAAGISPAALRLPPSRRGRRNPL